MNWYADSHLLNGSSGNACRMATISLKGESLVSQRQEIITSISNKSTSNISRRRRKATDETRKKHREAYTAAQRRKVEKALDNAAGKKAQISEKVKRIDSQYYELRQQRLRRISHFIRLMQDEEKEWKRRRSWIIMSGACDNDDILSILILVLLALGSPIWLCLVFLHKIWVKIYNMFH